jgi:bifunctional UDP-N-acetylglucosamine pyrophosphorylase/glucosamine-1-phosphate N-acetyltransferase
MKAVILTAGEGTRLKPITSTCPKPMIPIAGKPLIEHTILALKSVGIEEILLIVGYKEDMIKEYFGNGQDIFNIKIEYITQDEYLGTAHATGYAKDFINDGKSFLMMNGDLVVDPAVFKEITRKFEDSKAKNLISLLEVDNPHNYGIISLNSKGYVEKIIEKPSPDQKVGNLANAGIYIFDPMIFKAIEKTEKSVRNEFELTDSMEILIEQLNGKIIGYVMKNRFWNDIGLPWQLLEANNYLLDNIDYKILGTIEENVNISENVYVGKNTVIKTGTTIQGPCFIGENNLIGPNAFIRPYTFINDNCHVGMSEIKNSIVLSNTAIPHFNYVGDSVICEKVNLGAGTKISNLRFDDNSVKMNIRGKLVDSKRRKLGAIIGAGVKTGINSSIMCGKLIGEGAIIGAHTLVMEDVAPNTLFYHDPNLGIVKKPLKK